MAIRTSRFSGAEWADQLVPITLVGAGGIGSWTALNLSRIGHELAIWDGDIVDETNVHGGQMYRTKDINSTKVGAVYSICREFGTIATLDPIDEMFSGDNLNKITITGLDNMAARKTVFESWVRQWGSNKDALLIDGRLLMENMEVITLQGGNPEMIKRYNEEFLFDDSEVEELDCTSKQSTFSAMVISGLITATLCNFLTNRKLDMEIREVPFHQKFLLPIFRSETINIEALQAELITE